MRRPPHVASASAALLFAALVPPAAHADDDVDRPPPNGADIGLAVSSVHPSLANVVFATPKGGYVARTIGFRTPAFRTYGLTVSADYAFFYVRAGFDIGTSSPDATPPVEFAKSTVTLSRYGVEIGAVLRLVHRVRFTGGVVFGVQHDDLAVPAYATCASCAVQGGSDRVPWIEPRLSASVILGDRVRNLDLLGAAVGVFVGAQPFFGLRSWDVGVTLSFAMHPVA